MNWWQAVLLIVVTAVVTWIGHAVIARREAKIQRAIHRDDLKRELYVSYCEFWLKGLATGNIGEIGEAEIKEKMANFTVQMLLFASDETYKLFADMQQWSYQNADIIAKGEGAEHFPQMGLLLGGIIKSMRRDYSYPWTSLKPEEVFKPFLTDYYKIFPKNEKKRRKEPS